MGSIVEIDSPATSVTCDASGAAKHVINIHNTSGRKLRIGVNVLPDAPAEADWIGRPFVVGKEGEQEWDIEADQVINLTVPIHADTAQAGKYTFRLEAYSTAAPSEDFSRSDGYGFEVPAHDGPPQPPPSFPWWIVILIVALLVVGGVAWFVIDRYVLKTEVPPIVGQTKEAAEQAVANAHLEFGPVTYRVVSEPAPDTVLEQDPTEGRVRKGTSVGVVLAQAPDPFRVSSLDLSVNPANYDGACPVTLNFRGRIATEGTAPGTVSYRFSKSDDSAMPIQQIEFAEVGAKTVSSSWQISRSLSGWQELATSAPNEMTSARASFSVRCADPFRVSTVTLAAAPTRYSGTCPVTINFKGTITTAGDHPGTISYRFARSDGASAQSQSLRFTSEGTKTVTNSWTIGKSYTGWQQLIITSPKEVRSAQAKFTIDCVSSPIQPPVIDDRIIRDIDETRLPVPSAPGDLREVR